MNEEKQVVSISRDMELGKIFAESGVFPDIESAAQGYVKILAGRELGFTPIQSLGFFYFVKGKNGVGRLGMLAQAIGALLKKSDKYDYEINNHTEQECNITFYKIDKEGNKDKIGETHFDTKMAAKAGIINKDNWKNYPMNMVFARALMNGVRWFCPDAGSGFYAVEELEDLAGPEKITTITIDKKSNVKKIENKEGE